VHALTDKRLEHLGVAGGARQRLDAVRDVEAASSAEATVKALAQVRALVPKEGYRLSVAEAPDKQLVTVGG